MNLLLSFLRPDRFLCVLSLAGLAAAMAFLTVATGALAQERYRSPEDAVAALVDAIRSDALQEMMRVLGPGSEEILRSGDPVDDAACAGVSSTPSGPRIRSFLTARTRPY